MILFHCQLRATLTLFLFRTYDQYTSELSSGHLIWSPVHDSETFWSENAMKLNESDYHQLKFIYVLTPHMSS
jgi:V-ATPase subunit H